MRKCLKKKKRSCGLCKPQKRGLQNRWKAKEYSRLQSAEREMKNAAVVDSDTVICVGVVDDSVGSFGEWRIPSRRSSAGSI
jgi:hypothetical protein